MINIGLTTSETLTYLGLEKPEPGAPVNTVSTELYTLPLQHVARVIAHEVAPQPQDDLAIVNYGLTWQGYKKQLFDQISGARAEMPIGQEDELTFRRGLAYFLAVGNALPLLQSLISVNRSLDSWAHINAALNQTLRSGVKATQAPDEATASILNSQQLGRFLVDNFRT